MRGWVGWVRLTIEDVGNCDCLQLVFWSILAGGLVVVDVDRGLVMEEIEETRHGWVAQVDWACDRGWGVVGWLSSGAM